VLQVHDDLYNGLREEIEEATRILLVARLGTRQGAGRGVGRGHAHRRHRFPRRILFVPEVLLAANAMKGGMAILRTAARRNGAEPIGKMVVGTVKGDIHDIGKNLVAMMMEGAGFEVIDLGINNPVEKYLAALEEHKPDILGLSALLTTTMPYMKVVIDTLKEQGNSRRLHRARRRRAAQRAVRNGGRRRCLLPRRGDRRRNREDAHCCAPGCARSMMRPTLTSFAAPRGGSQRPRRPAGAERRGLTTHCTGRSRWPS
jgi:5-methyltetrahydrofolate--homocysteine methyltransferase